MAVAMKSQLRLLREEIAPKISQETMARRVGVTLQWYRQIEAGGNTSYTTAKAILKALNEVRSECGMRSELLLDQLGLSIV